MTNPTNFESLKISRKDINNTRSIAKLEQWLEQVEAEQNYLKATFLVKGNQWTSTEAKLRSKQLKSLEISLRMHIRNRSAVKREIQIAKGKAKAKDESGMLKAVIGMARVLSRRENGQLNSHKAGQISPTLAAEIQAAPALELPPVGRQEQELIELIKQIQVEKPHLNAGEAMIEAQAKISAEGLPTEDFSLSSLLGQRPSKPEIEQEEQTNGK